MKYCFAPNRMAIIQKTANKKYRWRCGTIGTFTHYWREMCTGTVSLEHSFAMTTWHLLCNPAISLLGICPLFQKLKTYVHKNICMQMYIIAELSIMAPNKPSKFPLIGECTNKMKTFINTIWRIKCNHDIYYNMDKPQKCSAKLQKSNMKESLFYYQICMQCLEMANLWRQKADEWLSESGVRVKNWL